jgi:sterol desaturase/sphingolipid hydroxylase (fatty acid hydroxylase superfamily)
MGGLPVDLDDILHVSSLPGLAKLIQLSLGPVFLLTAIGSVLNMLTGRLSRIVDRARYIEEIFTPRDHPNHANQVRELRLLDRRMTIVNNAIFLCTASAVLICLVVAVMFLARLAGFGFARTLAVTFAAALALLIAGLVMFLVEVRVAVAAIKVRDELLERR